MAKKADTVRAIAVAEYIEPARKQGLKSVSLISGDVEKAAGLRNRSSLVCNALESGKFLRENRLALISKHAPPSGVSTTVRYTYGLEPVEGDQPRAQTVFDKLRELDGVLKGAYGPMGGDAFLRREREEFRDRLERG